MKVPIRFNAPPHHNLKVDGQTIPGGTVAEVSEQAAEELATAPYADVTILDEVDEAYESTQSDDPDLDADVTDSDDAAPEADDDAGESDEGEGEVVEDAELAPDRRSRPELNDLARQAGVFNPEYLSNRDAVIAAIREAEADAEPEVDDEGLQDDNEEDF